MFDAHAMFDPQAGLALVRAHHRELAEDTGAPIAHNGGSVPYCADCSPSPGAAGHSNIRHGRSDPPNEVPKLPAEACAVTHRTTRL